MRMTNGDMVGFAVIGLIEAEQLVLAIKKFLRFKFHDLDPPEVNCTFACII
uniref:Uncharacterized protein n=1 Tax=Rhizophora mucronata TaxID=61149 RepID=A0A2P2IRU4_RHIMU